MPRYPSFVTQFQTLIPRRTIAARVEHLGRQITADLAPALAADLEQRLVLMPVLTGALVFVADLIRHIPHQMNIRPVTISSYPGAATTSQGAAIQSAIPTDLQNQHVLIVDDILDSGRTLGLLKRLVAAQNPASLRIAVLLRKHKLPRLAHASAAWSIPADGVAPFHPAPNSQGATAISGRDEDVEVHYVGFDIDDLFVIGYGLDYDGYYRNLPDVGLLPPQPSPLV